MITLKQIKKVNKFILRKYLVFIYSQLVQDRWKLYFYQHNICLANQLKCCAKLYVIKTFSLTNFLFVYLNLE